MEDKIITPSGAVSLDDIVEMIEAKKCILFLGPKIYSSKDGNTIEKRIFEHLKEDNLFNAYYEEDGLFLFRDPIQKSRAIKSIAKTYQLLPPETVALFKKIIQIPFEIIVSLMPDKGLFNQAQKEGFGFQFSYYYKNRAPRSLDYDLMEVPLIYNFLGSFSEHESLVLTYNDFYDFLGSLFKEKSMDQKLKKELLDAESYIFLGFPFEKWYMRVLLRILSLHDVNTTRFIRIATGKHLAETVQSMYREELRIAFVPEKIGEFIETIFQKCQSSGILRQPQKLDRLRKLAPSLNMESVISKISIADYEGAMAILSSFVDTLDKKNNLTQSFKNRLVVEQSKYHQLKADKLSGVVSKQEMDIDQNRITRNLLELIKDIRNFSSKITELPGSSP